jgi:hypothetical protein
MEFEQFEYTIPTYYLPALIYGDWSGLSDEEEKKLSLFLASVFKTHGLGHWTTKDDVGSFFAKSDIDGLMADCTELIHNTRVKGN